MVFFDATTFPFLGKLKANWHVCLDEFNQLSREDYIVWPEPLVDSGRWLVFGLYGFGEKIPDNCLRCPRTSIMVEEIPGLFMAGFSILEPRTRIRPHFGYSSDVLRAHLGLRIPGGCGLRVTHERRTWEAGEWLIFDDTQEHEAWNDSESDRVILLVDFLRPGTETVSKLNVHHETSKMFREFQSNDQEEPISQRFDRG